MDQDERVEIRSKISLYSRRTKGKSLVSEPNPLSIEPPITSYDYGSHGEFFKG
jgi:hypothetical protein